MGDEQKIIEQIISGQTGPYQVLIERYQNPVFRIILKIVEDTEDARELTQDVFVKAYESILQYKPEYKFFSWIYRMAINNALLFVKRKKKMINTVNISPDTYQITDEHVDDDYRNYLINRSLQELNGNYQPVVLLKYFAGLSYADIAETLGISEKKVKSRLFDARKILKGKFSEYGIFS